MAKPKKSNKKKKVSPEKKTGVKTAAQKTKQSQIMAKRQPNLATSSRIWILIVILVAVGGYWLVKQSNQRQKTVSNQPLEMSVADVAQLDPEEWIFLDVREQYEWEEAHIEWATLIPLGQLAERHDELSTDKKIVVVCRSGNRSAEGRDILIKAGFKDVTSMAGGMNDWIDQGLPIVFGP